MKKFLALALAGMMVLSMSACGSKDKGGDAAGYKDGTYTSTQKGNNGDVTVEVKIEHFPVRSDRGKSLSEIIFSMPEDTR